MKIAIRYYSKTGNTKKLANAISEVTGVTAYSVDKPLEEDIDILFLGSSVYAAGVDNKVKKFITNINTNVGTIINFSTAAIIESTFNQVKKLAIANGLTISENEFHCRGQFTLFHKNRPNNKDIENVKLFAQQITQ